MRLPYKNFTKPGVRMLQQAITLIDPAKRRVTTDKGQFEADYLVVALGAEYDFTATPGLADVTEFYSEAAVAKMRDGSWPFPDRCKSAWPGHSASGDRASASPRGSSRARRSDCVC